MKVEAADKTVIAGPPWPPPRITVDADVRGNHTEIVGIDVVAPNGIVSRFWVGVYVGRGRPVLTVHTKPDRKRETNTKLQGTFNRL